MQSDKLPQSSVAWIGVGNMGLPIISHFINAGVDVHIYDINQANIKLAQNLGAKAYPDLGSLLREKKYIFTSLPNDQIFLELATSDKGVLELANKNSIYVDTSTISVSASEKVAEHAVKSCIKYVRVALSGNPTVAKAAQLTIIASGDKASYEEILPLLKLAGKTYFYIGEAEEARLMKLVINLMISVSAGMMAEALTLGRSGGLDWKQMLEIMESSAVASPMVKYKTPVLKKRDFTSTMSAIAQTKDIDLILDAGKSHGVPMQITATLRQMYQSLISQGNGHEDYIAIVKQVERAAGLNDKELL